MTDPAEQFTLMTDRPPQPSGTPAPDARSMLLAVLLAPFQARTWKELIYLIMTAGLGVLAGMYGLLGFGGTLYLSLFVIGIPLLACVLLGARVWGKVYRVLGLILLDAELPDPPPFTFQRSPWGWLRAAFTDRTAWRAVAFLVIQCVLGFGVGTGVLMLIFLVGMLALSPLLWFYGNPTNVDTQGVQHHSLIQFGDYYVETWPRVLGVGFIGLLGCFVLPWLIRGVCQIHRLTSYWLLTPTVHDQQLVELQESRRAAVNDSAATLRRLERDLHDGTQARLVSIAMMLGRAEERTAAGGEAGELIAQARSGTKEALTELRELVRGIHPPALELGLGPALETLAARCAIPVELRVLLPVRPTPAIETIAYFSVAELLTNVVKHAAATHIWVAVLPAGQSALAVSVRDNGQGGALQPAEIRGEAVVAGGLSGLAARARAVDGTLVVDSPVGGPTVVTMYLPIAGPQ
ncbi:sensor histidine kinase [Nocardia sp. NPDC020380]|uniref:sensor histidine kinase n=1 Tax=Nocardia sp. NPDC020380 TaxID=3364309 RepID=UPI0037AFF724